jgi:hypothetical protein
MTDDSFLQLLRDTIRKDPVLVALERQIENRQKELQQKYPIRIIGLTNQRY